MDPQRRRLDLSLPFSNVLRATDAALLLCREQTDFFGSCNGFFWRVFWRSNCKRSSKNPRRTRKEPSLVKELCASVLSAAVQCLDQSLAFLEDLSNNDGLKISSGLFVSDNTRLETSKSQLSTLTPRMHLFSSQRGSFCRSMYLHNHPVSPVRLTAFRPNFLRASFRRRTIGTQQTVLCYEAPPLHSLPSVTPNLATISGTSRT
jgi:hypothetical protein